MFPTGVSFGLLQGEVVDVDDPGAIDVEAEAAPAKACNAWRTAGESFSRAV